MRTITRDHLLAAGVRNLTEFDYPSVTKENILSEYLFRRFFASMIEDTLEKMPSLKPALDLKAEIEALDAKDKIGE